jgi:hypothetical protein
LRQLLFLFSVVFNPFVVQVFEELVLGPSLGVCSLGSYFGLTGWSSCPLSRSEIFSWAVSTPRWSSWRHRLEGTLFHLMFFLGPLGCCPPLHIVLSDHSLLVYPVCFLARFLRLLVYKLLLNLPLQLSVL